MLAVTCCLLIALANSLDHDQDQQNIDPPFDTLIVFLKEIYEKVNYEKGSRTNAWKLPSMQRVKPLRCRRQFCSFLETTGQGKVRIG